MKTINVYNNDDKLIATFYDVEEIKYYDSWITITTKHDWFDIENIWTVKVVE